MGASTVDGEALGAAMHLLRMASAQSDGSVAFLALRRPDGSFAITVFPPISEDDPWTLDTLENMAHEAWADPLLARNKVLVRGRQVSLRSSGPTRSEIAMVTAAPLIDDTQPEGRRGLLCVADHVHGHFGQDQLDVLATLAARIVAHLQAREQVLGSVLAPFDAAEDLIDAHSFGEPAMPVVEASNGSAAASEELPLHAYGRAPTADEFPDDVPAFEAAAGWRLEEPRRETSAFGTAFGGSWDIADEPSPWIGASSSFESVVEDNAPSDVADVWTPVIDEPSRVESTEEPSWSAIAEEPSWSAIAEEPSWSAIADEPSWSAIADEPSSSAVTDEPSWASVAQSEPTSAEIDDETLEAVLRRLDEQRLADEAQASAQAVERVEELAPLESFVPAGYSGGVEDKADERMPFDFLALPPLGDELAEPAVESVLSSGEEQGYDADAYEAIDTSDVVEETEDRWGRYEIYDEQIEAGEYGFGGTEEVPFASDVIDIDLQEVAAIHADVESALARWNEPNWSAEPEATVEGAGAGESSADDDDHSFDFAATFSDVVADAANDEALNDALAVMARMHEAAQQVEEPSEIEAEEIAIPQLQEVEAAAVMEALGDAAAAEAAEIAAVIEAAEAIGLFDEPVASEPVVETTSVTDEASALAAVHAGEATSEQARRPVAAALISGIRPDPVTGLPGLPTFLGQLGQTLGSLDLARKAVAVVLVEVERTDGSAPNDATMAAVAEQLAEQVRRGDAVARVGATVFAVQAVFGIGVSSAAAIKERVLDAVDEAVHWSPERVIVRASAVSAESAVAPDADALFTEAVEQLGID